MIIYGEKIITGKNNTDQSYKLTQNSKYIKIKCFCYIHLLPFSQ